MGQVHHGGATTTAAVRRAIQQSQESLRVLARRHGINPKTVAKWKKRTSVQDRLKTLRGLTPYEFVCQVWTKEPNRFRLDPSHHIPGSYS